MACRKEADGCSVSSLTDSKMAATTKDTTTILTTDGPPPSHSPPRTTYPKRATRPGGEGVEEGLSQTKQTSRVTQRSAGHRGVFGQRAEWGGSGGHLPASDDTARHQPRAEVTGAHPDLTGKVPGQLCPRAERMTDPPDVTGMTSATEPRTDVTGKTSATETVTDVTGKTSMTDPVTDVTGKTSATKTVTDVTGKTLMTDPLTDITGKTSATEPRTDVTGKTSATMTDITGKTSATEPLTSAAAAAAAAAGEGWWSEAESRSKGRGEGQTTRVTAEEHADGGGTWGRSRAGRDRRGRFGTRGDRGEGAQATDAAPGMAGESDSDVTRAGDSRHADDTEPRHFTCRKHKLLARRKGVNQHPPPPPAHPSPPAVDDGDDGKDVASTLDQRLQALDFMVSRSYRQEALLARRELQPRRFHKNPRLERRWHNARQLMLLQELLEHLHSAKQSEGQQGETAAEAQSSPVLDLSSPGARVTPEGQSSDEGAGRERDSPPGSSSSPQAETASPSGDNPQVRRRQPRLFPEIPAATSRTDESSVKTLITLTTIGQGKEQSVKTSTVIGPTDESSIKTPAVIGPTDESSIKTPAVIGPTDESSIKTSTAIGQTDESSIKTPTVIGQTDESAIKTTAIGRWQVTPCSQPCGRENTHLRSHSASCVGQQSCASVDNVALWNSTFLSLARQRQAEKRMRYLQESSPKIFQQIHKKAVNTTFDTRLSVPHDRHCHSNHLEPLPHPQNGATHSATHCATHSATHSATWSVLDPRPATAGARPPVLMDFRQLRTGTYGQIQEHPYGEVCVHHGEVHVHPIGEVHVHPFGEVHVHPCPHCEPQTKCILHPIHESPRTVPSATSGQVEETESYPLEFSPTSPETPRPQMCTGASAGTSANPTTNLVCQSYKPDVRRLFEFRVAVPHDPVHGQGLAGRQRVPAVSEWMRQRMQDITRIYSMPYGHRRFTPRPVPGMPTSKEGQR